MSAEVESFGSWPAITWRTLAASFVVSARGPIESKDDANATSPYRETRPYVGFKPTTPQNAAGWRIEPPVSDPKDVVDIPARTATAEPPLDPPGTRSSSCGSFTRPYAEFSVEEPIANSSILFLPIMTASALRKRWTTLASYNETKFSRILDPHVTRSSFTQIRSLIDTTIPANGPAFPSRSFLSIDLACSIALSGNTARSAFRCFFSSITRRYSSVIFSQVVVPSTSSVCITSNDFTDLAMRIVVCVRV